jgi:uncharacterized glyoxalase superfamily protein PhnB
MAAKKKKKVAPIPKSYKILTPYLAIQGATQALDWYKKAFGAKERMRMPGPDGKIGHARAPVRRLRPHAGRRVPRHEHPRRRPSTGRRCSSIFT